MPLRSSPSARSPASPSGYRDSPVTCGSPTRPVTPWPGRCSPSATSRSPARPGHAARQASQSSAPADRKAPPAPQARPAHPGARARPGRPEQAAPLAWRVHRVRAAPPGPSARQAPPDPRARPDQPGLRATRDRRATRATRARPVPRVRRVRPATACRLRRGMRTRWCVRGMRRRIRRLLRRILRRCCCWVVQCWPAGGRVSAPVSRVVIVLVRIVEWSVYV